MPPAERDQAPAHLQGEVAGYYDRFLTPAPFVPGETPVPVSGKVWDAEELQALVEASLDGWWTEGRFTQAVQLELSRFLGVGKVALCNSGSSANLLAFTALTSKLLGERRIRPGSEVISVAAGFPTTLAPIVQNRCLPVLLDIELGTHIIDVTRLEEAVTPKTRAVMIAHTLGNPWDVDAVLAFAKRHGLWVIEDCCDALGATCGGRMVGTFGDVATLSFYPAHQMTCGEGGAVLTQSGLVKRSLESFRDWGSDCWCMPGKTDTCERRFEWQLGELPHGYDHKYKYSEIGYDLKSTDLQGDLLQASSRGSRGSSPRVAATTPCWRRRSSLSSLGSCRRARQRTPFPPGLATPSPCARAAGSPAPSWSGTSSATRSTPGCCSPGTRCASRPSKTWSTASSGIS